MRNISKAVALFLCVCTFAMGTYVFAGDIAVKVNGAPIVFDVQPTMIENRTMVPLREVAGFFGATVAWDSQKKACNIKLGRKTSTVAIGSKIANVGGFSVESNPPAKIINGTLYVSSRLLSKTVSGGVAWDAYTRTITLAVP